MKMRRCLFCGKPAKWGSDFCSDICKEKHARKRDGFYNKNNFDLVYGAINKPKKEAP
jgi:predicted nucleic acid-binding Zn ribbon protein